MLSSPTRHSRAMRRLSVVSFFPGGTGCLSRRPSARFRLYVARCIVHHMCTLSGSHTAAERAGPHYMYQYSYSTALICTEQVLTEWCPHAGGSVPR